MWYDSKYNTADGRKDYLACDVRRTLGTVLWHKAVKALSVGEMVPDSTLDEMLGTPSTLTMTDWKVYTIRKRALREHLTQVALSPTLVKQYVDEYGNKSN